jgi:molecular chaperone Hsp33
VREPKAILPLKDGKLDVAGGLGHSGFLTVTKDLRMKEPYTGMVQLYTSEIAEDLAYYLMESEQIPSAVGLGVYLEPDGRASAGGGFLIQSLPSSDDTMVDRLIAQIGKLPPVTELLRSGKSPEDLLELIFSGISYRILEKRVIAFQCSCNRERVERALLTLGKRGVEDLLVEHGQVEMTCEFCRERYLFTEEDLAWIHGEVQ